MAYLCPKCGQAFEAGKRFCVACGTSAKDSPGVACCRSCGAVGGEGAGFCTLCGGAIARPKAAAKPATPRPRFCTQCGKPAQPETRFCRGCGAKFTETVAAAAEPSAVPPRAPMLRPSPAPIILTAVDTVPDTPLSSHTDVVATPVVPPPAPLLSPEPADAVVLLMSEEVPAQASLPESVQLSSEVPEISPAMAHQAAASVPPVQLVDAKAAPASHAEQTPPDAPPAVTARTIPAKQDSAAQPPRSGRTKARAMAAAAVVLIAGAVAVVMWTRSDSSPDGDSSALASASSTPGGPPAGVGQLKAQPSIPIAKTKAQLDLDDALKQLP